MYPERRSMPTASAAGICACRTVSPRQSASSKAPADLARCWNTRRECWRPSAPPLSQTVAASYLDLVKHQARTRPDDHRGNPKLILVDVDHGILIMKEGSE